MLWLRRSLSMYSYHLRHQLLRNGWYRRKYIWKYHNHNRWYHIPYIRLSVLRSNAHPISKHVTGCPSDTVGQGTQCYYCLCCWELPVCLSRAHMYKAQDLIFSAYMSASRWLQGQKGIRSCIWIPLRRYILHQRMHRLCIPTYKWRKMLPYLQKVYMRIQNTARYRIRFLLQGRSYRSIQQILHTDLKERLIRWEG